MARVLVLKERQKITPHWQNRKVCAIVCKIHLMMCVLSLVCHPLLQMLARDVEAKSYQYHSL